MATNCKDIDEPSGVEVKLRFTVCVVNVNEEYEPLYEPPHDKVGIEVVVGVGVGVSVFVGVCVGVLVGVGDAAGAVQIELIV
jgi:hypothetical protein